jgi:hypothetical protein
LNPPIVLMAVISFLSAFAPDVFRFNRFHTARWITLLF